VPATSTSVMCVVCAVSTLMVCRRWRAACLSARLTLVCPRPVACRHVVMSVSAPLRLCMLWRCGMPACLSCHLCGPVMPVSVLRCLGSCLLLMLVTCLHWRASCRVWMMSCLVVVWSLGPVTRRLCHLRWVACLMIAMRVWMVCPVRWCVVGRVVRR